MDPQEIDGALNELETRLDRLRALYEQYFLGIEKIEPTVVRKDVDRRFWILRRTQIRNTARRFKLQTLIQRYNTFQQYWTRICREIENGTYARHLLRAQKKVGAEPRTWAAKKRLGMLRHLHEQWRDAGADNGSSERATLDDDGGSEIDDLLAASEQFVASEVARALAAAEELATKPRAPAPKLTPIGLELELDEPRMPAPTAREAPPPLPSRKLPLPTRRAPLSGEEAHSRLPLPSRSEVAAGQQGGPVNTSAQSAQRAAPANVPIIAKPIRPIEPRGDWSALQHPARRPAPRGQEPARRAAPANETGPSARRAAPANETGVSDARVRELHAELVATRKRLNQNASVSVDGLAKTLRETENKLIGQHKGRAVDFQVVVKDGQAVVKPVVRK